MKISLAIRGGIDDFIKKVKEKGGAWQKWKKILNMTFTQAPGAQKNCPCTSSFRFPLLLVKVFRVTKNSLSQRKRDSERERERESPYHETFASPYIFAPRFIIFVPFYTPPYAFAPP